MRLLNLFLLTVSLCMSIACMFVCSARPARAADDKNHVNKASTTNTKQQKTDTEKAADVALSDGLSGKAARLYEEAWNAGQNNPELGLKAADLYANRLGQPVDAARVLRHVINATSGSSVAARANAKLEKLNATLLAEAHVAAARKQQGAEALQSLRQAEDADPTYSDIYELRAKIVAKGDSIEALQDAIKALARRDLAKPALLASLPKINKWLQQPVFSEFLTDLLGSKIADQVRQTEVPKVPEIVVLESKFSKITLPHKKHLERFTCCNCHGDSMPGPMEFGKKKGHTVCMGCHERNGGPQSCGGCHKREPMSDAAYKILMPGPSYEDY